MSNVAIGLIMAVIFGGVTVFLASRVPELPPKDKREEEKKA